MAAFGMAIGWFGYGFASWGYCLMRGYDVKLTDWLNPIHPYTGGWPPPQIPDTSILPTGASGTTSTTSKTKKKTTTKKKA
jgi:hypothetical protein